MISNIKRRLRACGKNAESLKDRGTTLLIMMESEITALNLIAQGVFLQLEGEQKKKTHSLLIDSPVERTYSYGLEQLNIIYKEYIPGDFNIQLLEHGSPDVKAFISDKIDKNLTGAFS